MIYLKLFLTAVFWGGTFIAGRSLGGHVDPFSAAFFRFVIASICLVAVTWHREGRLPMPGSRQWLPLVVLGMTGVFSYNVLFFKGLSLIEAGRASVIIANNPVFIALFSAILFREPLRPSKAMGVVLSVFGALVVITRGEFAALLSGGFGWGEIYIFGCVASWVTYSLVGKVVMREIPPLEAVSYASLIGAAALAVPAWMEGMPKALFAYRAVDWLNLAYLGVCGTVLGFVWYYQGIRKIGAIRASQFINFVPVSAIVLAFLLLGEPVTPSLVAGGALVVCGVYLTNRPESSASAAQGADGGKP
ncbi:MAG: DMT family transporter [Desulfobacteraceae bacterium]|nr:DMT family transporter [Desulfobacteraceae bacterium]